VIFKGRSGIWITNPDGSFPTRLSEYEFQGDLHRALSPAGDRLALVVSNDQGLDLVIVKIPSGETEKITRLIQRTPEQALDATSPNSFAAYAIRDYESLAWQPGGGQLLAFVGAMNGPTADLYLYDLQSQLITQLTDGPSQAVLPEWSPDGKYIVHFGVSWVLPFEGAIVGANRLDGMWAVQASDGKVITLPKPKGSLPNFVGWQDDAHFITFDSGDCYSENLRSVAVPGGEINPIMEYSFWYNIAQSTENSALLFSSKKECASSLEEGAFLLFTAQSEPVQLLEQRAWEIYWMPESKVFNAYPEGLFTSDGQTRYDPPVYEASYKPAVSKQDYQASEVIENRKGRVVVRAPGGDWQTIIEGLVSQLIWDPLQGSILLIAMDDGSLYAATSPDFSLRLMGNLGDGPDQAIWSP
jgi:hypothetical protein